MIACLSSLGNLILSNRIVERFLRASAPGCVRTKDSALGSTFMAKFLGPLHPFGQYHCQKVTKSRMTQMTFIWVSTFEQVTRQSKLSDCVLSSDSTSLDFLNAIMPFVTHQVLSAFHIHLSSKFGAQGAVEVVVQF